MCDDIKHWCCFEELCKFARPIRRLVDHGRNLGGKHRPTTNANYFNNRILSCIIISIWNCVLLHFLFSPFRFFKEAACWFIYELYLDGLLSYRKTNSWLCKQGGWKQFFFNRVQASEDRSEDKTNQSNPFLCKSEKLFESPEVFHSNFVCKRN